MSEIAFFRFVLERAIMQNFLLRQSGRTIYKLKYTSFTSLFILSRNITNIFDVAVGLTIEAPPEARNSAPAVIAEDSIFAGPKEKLFGSQI